MHYNAWTTGSTIEEVDEGWGPRAREPFHPFFISRTSYMLFAAATLRKTVHTRNRL